MDNLEYGETVAWLSHYLLSDNFEESEVWPLIHTHVGNFQGLLLHIAEAALVFQMYSDKFIDGGYYWTQAAESFGDSLWHDWGDAIIPSDSRMKYYAKIAIHRNLI